MGGSAIRHIGSESTRRGEILGSRALCECRHCLHFAAAFFRRDIGGGESHVSDDEVRVNGQSAAKKRGVFLRGDTVRRKGTDSGHDGPRTFRIFLDGRATVIFRQPCGTDVNQLRTFRKNFERPVGLRGARSWWRRSRREALDEDAVTASELDAIEKFRRRGEIDAASRDQLGEVAGGVALGKAAEDFGAVERNGLSEDTRRQEREEGQESGASLHGDMDSYSGRRHRKL